QVLLLGSSNSGKSTLLKQMLFINGAVSDRSDIDSYRQLVLEETMRELHRLAESLPELGLSLPDELSANKYHIPRSGWDYPWGRTVLEGLLGTCTALLNDPAIQNALRRGDEIGLQENLSYFLTALPRVFSPSYNPTQQDILHLRVKSTGITTTNVRAGAIEMLLMDVSIAIIYLSEKKWVHVFPDVTTVVFVVSLSGYDRHLEDNPINQIQEDLTLWESIAGTRWFKGTSMILCLNKEDLFKKKILSSHLVDYFPDFKGGRDAVAGREYIRTRFRNIGHAVGRVTGKDLFIQYVT
ncbi:guanine nucleotide binding protein, alpha subunit, partial [Mycena epipterygia]